MGFDKRNLQLTVPSTPATVTTGFNARSQYIRMLGFDILLTGTDTAVKLRLTDADSRIFYLDAADKDYKTARIFTPLLYDDVVTGLGPVTIDSTGAAAGVGQMTFMPVVRSPIEVAIINGGTGGDVIDINFEYEYGVFGAKTFSLPTAAATIATKTISLDSKFAQICGFKALSVGTSTTQRLSIVDTDGKIVYLDAADANYDAAALDRNLALDSTVTGLTRVVPRDATGAAIQATVAATPGLPLVRSPITVNLTSSEGNDEVVTMTLYYKTG